MRAILARHRRGYDPHTGEDWCLSCDEPWPCATVARVKTCDRYEAALRQMTEMDHLIDIKELANTTLNDA
jgi:hypothetical protein